MEATQQATQTWYRVSKTYGIGKYDAREVVRVTEKTVTFLSPRHTWKGEPLTPEERRENRETTDYAWVQSEREAVSLARTLLTARRDAAVTQLSRAEAVLAAFNEAHPED